MHSRLFSVAIIGSRAAESGWAALLAEDGVPCRYYQSIDQVEGVPDFTIILRGGIPDSRRWSKSHAILDHCYPPDAVLDAEVRGECLFTEEGETCACLFRGYAVQWYGPTRGWFLLGQEDESPRFPVACHSGRFTYVCVDISAALNSVGFTFSPVCSFDDRQVHLLHPAARREILIRFLRQLFREALQRAGLPAFRLSPYPPGSRTPFLLRLDVDYQVEKGLLSLRRIASEHEFKITAFINISGEEEWEDGTVPPPPGNCQPVKDLYWLREFSSEGHECAGHGYHHRLWPDPEKQREDLRRAKEILEKIISSRIYGNAFAGGFWPPRAGRAARQSGYVYSTEAALSWGGNPYYPENKKEAFPLQIPCSPVYAAYHLMDAYPYSATLFLSHFTQQAKVAARNREPLSLLVHPHDCEGLAGSGWEKISEVVRAYDLQPITFYGLYLWIMERAKVVLTITYQNGRYWAESSRKWELFSGQEWITLEPGVKFCLA